MQTKRKSKSHIIEKRSLQIIEDILPEYWTTRNYKPDYGIDLSIELFEEKESNKYDTLGEHIFIQVKGTEKIKKGNFKIKERNNIENEPIKEKDTYKNLEVIKFQIDTVELRTIQRMGNSVPVLLFLVDTTNEQIYFICLNDYIDKVILPSDPLYFKKKSLTLNIPSENLIDNKNLLPIYLYAKRPKYYAFFVKVGYQYNELQFSGNSIIEQSQHFAKILLFQDVFAQKNNWHIMDSIKEELLYLIEKAEGPSEKVNATKLDSTEKIWAMNGNENELFTEYDMMNRFSINALWQQMDNLKNMYESVCREWYLPTYLSDIVK